MAVGIVGIGAGLGFFAGPQYAGWRAETAHWTFLHVGNWQRPCVEFGFIGIVVGILFLILAKEVPHGPSTRDNRPLSNRLRRRAAAVSLVISARDFAGVATLSLASIYLQKARGMDARQAGFILGAMTLISMLVNPLLVWLTPGRRRLPALATVLLCGGAWLAFVPHWPVAWVLPVLCIFQALHLGSYALAEAGVLERISPATRGRIVGLLITIAGTIASFAPAAMGAWTDAVKDRANDPTAYNVPFAVLGGLMALATFAVPLIARLGDAAKEHAIHPLTEIVPQTVEAVG
jgi:MFS family permease